MKTSYSATILLSTLFLILNTMHANSQNPIKTYDANWKKVADLQATGLAKSALTGVREIYRLARQEKQDAQVIKAAIAMVNLQSEFREDNEIAAIKDLEAELANSSGVVNSIFSSLLASYYYNYYQQKRWQLYQRTETTGFLKEDIDTWSTTDFHHRIAELYLASLSNENELQQTKLEPFDAIITKGNARQLRPTLYDLLAHNALRYFSSDEPELKRPGYAFEINSASAFDPAADFIHRHFETKDSTSLELYALKLYQKLIAFHMHDPVADALIDVDLARIQYVKQKSVHENTDELYYLAINHVANQYQQTPAAAQAWYLLAQYHFDLGTAYKIREDSTNRFAKVQAVSICKEIIRQNPTSEGGVNAANLLSRIRQKALQFNAEQVLVPAKPFLIFVEYQNINKLYLRLVNSTPSLLKDFDRRNSDAFWRTVSKATAIRNWEQTLPDTKDYQEHSVEIKADALPAGEYMLLASSSPDFSDTQSIGGVRLLYVSNISYIQRERDYFVLHRDTGQPLAGATVKRWDSAFDYQTRTYKKSLAAHYTTDKNGYFKESMPSQSKVQSESFEMLHGNDRLFIQESINTYYNDEEEKEDAGTTIYLFTDRSLYRPGQTVYFKGIVAEGTSVLKDKTRKIEVKLQNANYEEVETVTKTVNDFGSFSGSFVLPGTSLNGEFSILADDDYSVSFQVEEYKRPRFAVSFDTLRNTYKLGDTIRVTGTGTAYAGNRIDGAKVVYRVVRNERFLYPWTRRASYFPLSPPKEITHGETVTDQEGHFYVSFEAIPDAKSDRNFDPVFNYTIYADVTDTNGETRSAETSVSVGYKSLLIKAEIPERVSADDFTQLKIRTENMNGEFVSAEAKVKLTRLIPESRLIRSRYWAQPDMFVMTKSEFIASFPNDEYNNETEKENWPEQKVVFEKSQALTADKELAFPGGKVAAGFYKIDIAATGQDGDEVKDTRYIELTEETNPKLLKPEYQWTKSGPAVEPGEKTNVQFATSAPDVFLISTSGRTENPANFSFLKLNDEKRTFPILAKEADRGGYAIDYVFVKHNRVHQAQNFVNVPWTNKELTIEYATFRDKALPGSKEQWKVKISGYRKGQVAAEMLASMYDTSLDQFYQHQWTKPGHWPTGRTLNRWGNGINFTPKDATIVNFLFTSEKAFEKSYDQLIDPDIIRMSSGGGRNARYRRSLSMDQLSYKKGEMHEEEIATSVPAPPMLGDATRELQEVVTVGYGQTKPKSPAAEPEKTKVRKNFNETAFFLPDLKTDENGAITFSFTLPEALTRWKFQALAHTPELAFGYSKKEIVTQKELMVQPNAPRFLREGDQILFPAKIVNLSDRTLNGNATLQLFDPATNENVTAHFGLISNEKAFSITAGQSATVDFNLNIPAGYHHALTWRVVAKAANLSDGEENTLPVLSNRMLVTESLPLTMRGSGKKEFRFEKLINSANSKSLAHESVTVEYTSNPAWYAVQALPYLIEYPHECAEQTWNRYYANAVASNIVSKSPRIAAIFNSWKTVDTAALASNLQKNQELKSLLLEETPWVLAAKSESEQKRNIALLFDLIKMKGELDTYLAKLREMQNESGGFPWFKGGHKDRYITQYIVTGIGRLLQKKVIAENRDINAIIEKAFPYLDRQIKEDYDRLIKNQVNMQEYVPGPQQVQYLYMRTCFDDAPIETTAFDAYEFFLQRARASWPKQSKYMQGLIALMLHRSKDAATPKAILKSLRETSISNEELGMYWKNTRSWWWHEAPIEQQALLIEAFHEIAGDSATVDKLKTWLLKNKQTNRWESTRATAEACHALLLTGNNWLVEEKAPTVRIGSEVIKPDNVESGTGYFKKAFESSVVNAEMGKIEVDISSSSNSKSPSWGAVYWQYFEDLDQITFSETPLKLSKKLFIQTNTDRGPVLSEVKEGDSVKVGDKIVVRIELRVDRDMEYVHMKDMHAAALEPVNVLSGYKWQGGLGYYESTKDASTNFFFDRLRKGTYVFEYQLFVNHQGNFSNGITSIQCMYAPEFTAHSEGIRISIRK
ncbi:alpha-2-macroglobulin [Dyadobacter sp. Leaf189]|uniref:alpha-2-macroglobulin family protein n=1 Tax=Dyadobacter sp. Leaf189 TaxID=1736295 RepID=UPI0006F49224|nr:alpha-2-macroglobulin family protein [Dyadobacter sp. Leaf189]KQS24839.1 alpha-2-macroglobulin [Dyadobacter sp. Leaf189]